MFITKLLRRLFCKTKHKYDLIDTLKKVKESGYKGYAEILSEMSSSDRNEMYKM